ncbi:hypothetical protein BDZ45DRAFT_636317 [Acephala macrosclerotiorum]|nr:hypothetical protein BDZ45DRAFT_636317 [Acephala macrosclerotiorum]
MLELMAGLSDQQLKVIQDNPLTDALNDFRTTLKLAYPDADFQDPLFKFEHLVTDSVGRSLALKLIGILLLLPTSSALHSDDGRTPLNGEIALVYARLSSNQTEFIHTVQLLKNVVTCVEDATIWSSVIDLISRTRPIHRPATPQSNISFVASYQQTPWSFNTGSFANTSDLRRDVDPILKDELEGNLIIDHADFFNKFFDGVSQLGEVAATVFERCKKAETPLYSEGIGWVEWPEDCNESKVLRWLRQRIDQFLQFAHAEGFQPPTLRRCFATPNKPISGSISKRKLDVGIAYDRRNETPASSALLENTDDGLPCDWSDVLVPGELKSNPREDNYSSTWFDLSRYAREIFYAEDTRRSVLGFTLCGSIMRLWEFDRLGGVASESFDIHEDGLMFISVILGFFWMTERELGFDPTIHQNKGGRYIKITTDGQPEQLHLDKVIKRQRCVAGRATTCWGAYRDGDKAGSHFVVKDSWEDEERPEEGLLLKKLTEAGVENVAEYYYHETLCVGSAIDDIRNNVRKGLKDEGGKYAFRKGHFNSDTLAGSSKSDAALAQRLMSGGRGRTRSISRKRSSSSRQASNPPPKRACSDSPIKEDRMRQRKNRVHRRLIMRRVGKSIYDASSPAAMITGVLGGIKGHESSLKRNVLHRDISVGNIMLEQTEEDGFLIDFDLAIEIDRKEASGAPSMTGTKVFMAIGALYGEHHSFMHDLESFFWVLFWVCIHWNGPGQGTSRTEYESWNYKDTKELAEIKKGKVDEEDKFTLEVTRNFSSYCRPLIPCIQDLRNVVFPGGRRQLDENRELYSRMRSVLENARNYLGATTM